MELIVYEVRRKIWLERYGEFKLLKAKMRGVYIPGSKKWRAIEHFGARDDKAGTALYASYHGGSVLTELLKGGTRLGEEIGLLRSSSLKDKKKKMIEKII